MYVVPFLLGEAALRQQKWEEASVELRRCLELNPNFDQAMMGLARSLLFLNKPAEAKQWVRSALKLNPQNYRAWYQLGFIESLSDKDEALADYHKSLSIQENFAPLRRDLGMLYYQMQDYPNAAIHLFRATELGVREAGTYNALGVSYRHTGRLSAAIKSYKEALTLDPSMAEAHLNLAYAYQLTGKLQPAQVEYREACRLEPRFCKFAPSPG